MPISRSVWLSSERSSATVARAASCLRTSTKALVAIPTMLRAAVPADGRPNGKMSSAISVLLFLLLRRQHGREPKSTRRGKLSDALKSGLRSPEDFGFFGSAPAGAAAPFEWTLDRRDPVHSRAAGVSPAQFY